MANKKKKSVASSQLQSLTFTIEAYPEWDYFINILSYLQKYKYAYIMHDKDINEETGEVKKPHAHIVIKYGGRRTVSVVKKEFKLLGVPENLVNTCNQRAMLRYLLHLDNPEKYQYPKEEVKTNMIHECQSSWNDEISSEEAFRLLNDYISSSEKRISQADLNSYAIKHGLLRGLRSYGSHINGARIEHNQEFEYHQQLNLAKDRIKIAENEKAKWIHNYQVSAKENMELRGITVDEEKTDIWEGLDDYNNK